MEIDRKPLPVVLGLIRNNIEHLLVAILMALTIRHYGLEPFQIPTGSMATTLLGSHALVTCPNCGWEFPRAVSKETGQMHPVNRCPHCVKSIEPGPEHIEYWSGEKILADKFSWRFTDTERYDTLVFRPPSENINYIKRAVSLGGETLYMIQGDLWVQKEGDENRVIVPKPEHVQDQVWIPVYDMNFDKASTSYFELGEGWNRQLNGESQTIAYAFEGSEKLKWKRAGRTTVSDDLSYNRRGRDGGTKIVGDLRLDGVVTLNELEGAEKQFSIHMTDGDLVFELRLADTATLICIGSDNKAVLPLEWSHGLSAESLKNGLRFSFRNWDDQVMVSLGGEVVLPLTSVNGLRSSFDRNGSHDHDGFSFEALGLKGKLTGLKMWRDIYYYHSGQRYYWKVPAGHFFVLGDNTHNSKDSRVTEFGAISQKKIQGRPWLRSIHWDLMKPFSPHDDWRFGRVY